MVVRKSVGFDEKKSPNRDWSLVVYATFFQVSANVRFKFIIFWSSQKKTKSIGLLIRINIFFISASFSPQSSIKHLLNQTSCEQTKELAFELNFEPMAVVVNDKST